MIPWLYLKGVSTGDFSEALGADPRPRRAGLSATTITRLKAIWEGEYEAWEQAEPGGQAQLRLRLEPTASISTSGWSRTASASWS